MDMENKLETMRKEHEGSKAYERLINLFDEETFFEIDPLAKSGDSAVEVLAGFGSVEGFPAYAFSQDVSSDGGAMSKAHASKIKKVFELAVKAGAPVVGIYDSNGAKLEEGNEMMSSFGEILALGNNLSGVVPQISVVMGACQGVAALVAASADIVIMTNDAKLQLSIDGSGGAAPEVRSEGISHITVQYGSEAISAARSLITLLPSNNLASSDFAEYTDANDMQLSLQQASQAVSSGVSSADILLRALADENSAIELQKGFGSPVVTALCRIGGGTAGIIVADGGVLTADSASKAARFVRLCDAFSLPVVTFINTTGITSLKQASMLTHAYAEATTVKISVVTGSAIGAAFVALAGTGSGADLTLAWPAAVISALSPEAAVEVLWRDKLKSMKDPLTDRARIVEEYKNTEAAPVSAAAGGFINDIIDPPLTRAALISALDMLAGKRVSRLPKKHSNIQL